MKILGREWSLTDARQFIKNKWPRRIGLALGIILPFVILYLSFIHYTEPGYVGIKRNLITGELSLDHPGWNVNPPWVWVAMMNVKPERVCITTTARAYNCKLVQFVPEEYRAFVATEGWRYWWWSNRISFNFGYDEEYRGVRDVLRGYAFSNKSYPFIVILKDYDEQP